MHVAKDRSIKYVRKSNAGWPCAPRSRICSQPHFHTCASLMLGVQFQRRLWFIIIKRSSNTNIPITHLLVLLWDDNADDNADLMVFDYTMEMKQMSWSNYWHLLWRVPVEVTRVFSRTACYCHSCLVDWHLRDIQQIGIQSKVIDLKY